jgi:pimeloyl-ACP methyl ester carboxylesterase
VRLPGGPGFDGLDEDLRRGYYERNVRPYVEFTDFVVVGQRGIGPSRPHTLCPTGGGPAAFSRRCREYWEGQGLDVRGFTVLEAAADVADAVRALGYSRVVLRGGSFGSHWAMAVMRHHPEVVAWALLSGTEGPDHTYDSPTGILNALRRMAAAAEQSPALAPLIPPGGLLGALEAVHGRLSAAPESVTVTTAQGKAYTLRFTAEDVPGFSTGYTRGLGSREGAATWPADILRLYYGDFETVARQRAERIARSEEGSGGVPGTSTAGEYLLDCASGSTPERLDRLRQDPAARLVGAEFRWYEETCAPWDVSVGDDFRRAFRTDVPTAIVHGTWDVNTPFENALELLPRFSRGKLVPVVGGSHGALGEAMRLDSAFAAAMWRYVRTGDLSVFPDSVTLPPIEWDVPADLHELAARRRGGGIR